MVKALAVLVALLIGGAAQAQEIKGLSLGMTKEEVKALYPTWKDFTIAGIRPKYESSSPVQEYTANGKVSNIIFFFKPSDFDTMVVAIKDKYPKLECVESKVTNAMGATFDQTRCKFQNLSLTRLVNLETSDLSLVDVAELARQKLEKDQKAKKDL